MGQERLLCSWVGAKRGCLASLGARWPEAATVADSQPDKCVAIAHNSQPSLRCFRDNQQLIRPRAQTRLPSPAAQHLTAVVSPAPTDPKPGAPQGYTASSCPPAAHPALYLLGLSSCPDAPSSCTPAAQEVTVPASSLSSGCPFTPQTLSAERSLDEGCCLPAPSPSSQNVGEHKSEVTGERPKGVPVIGCPAQPMLPNNTPSAAPSFRGPWQRH